VALVTEFDERATRRRRSDRLEFLRRIRRGSWLTIAAFSTAPLATVLPILWTPYAGDDVINATLPEVMVRDRASWWDVVSDLTLDWIRAQGRFFPGAVAYGATVFTVFTSRLVYKTFVVAMLCAALLAFGTWLRRSTGSTALALVAVTTVVSGWQFRAPTWHDSVTSYAAMFPYVCVLMFVTLVLLCRPTVPPVWHLVVAALLWAVASVTYEVVVLLAPAAIAALWLRPAERRARLWGAVSIAAPTAVDLLVVAIVRSQLERKSAPGYTLNLAPGDVLATTWQQMVAAIPLSQRWGAADLRPVADIGIVVTLAALALFCVTAAVLWATWRQVSTFPNVRLLAVIGAWLWLAPSALVGVTQRWQVELPTGQGYLSVMFESFGLALVVVAALAQLRRIATTGAGAKANIATIGAGVLLGGIAAAVGLNAAFNIGVAAHYS
jgi:hypothetical protein